MDGSEHAEPHRPVHFVPCAVAAPPPRTGRPPGRHPRRPAAGRERKTRRSPARARIIMGEPKRASQGRENARRATAFRSRRGSRVAHTVGATATATGTCVTTYPRTRARAAGRDGKEESRPRVYPVTSTSATPVRASLHGRFAFGRARARIGGSPIRSCSSSRVDLCLALFRRLPLGFSLIKQLFCLAKELRLLLS